MNDPEFAAFDDRVRELLAKARETLGTIEMQVRESGEVPALMQASRTYARFCMHVRDYLTGAHAGRPMPRRFAQRVIELRDELAPNAEAVATLGPTPGDLTDLAARAERLPGSS